MTIATIANAQFASKDAHNANTTRYTTGKKLENSLESRLPANFRISLNLKALAGQHAGNPSCIYLIEETNGDLGYVRGGSVPGNCVAVYKHGGKGYYWLDTYRVLDHGFLGNKTESEVGQLTRKDLPNGFTRWGI